tara:strand:- start:1098 stop:1943 length:846 start_codon:yes stop_codon:yes gene_type:complete
LGIFRRLEMRRSGGAHRNLFGGRFRRVKGTKRYSSDEDDDETLLFSNENNTYTSNNTLVEVASGRAKKAWRTLPINTPEQILADEDPTCHVVFPAGIYLQIVSNPNPCDMVLSFQLEDFIDKDPAVIVPSMGAVHDVEILPPPPEDGPRSQKWCELFGIVCIGSPLPLHSIIGILTFFPIAPQITENNLGKGIVEHKENGDLVVWRKFRHNVELLTPFAMFKHRELDSSTSPYMLYSKEDYAKLLRACRGFHVDKITVTAKPLFSKFETLDLKPVNTPISL